jgi:protein TonB
LVLAGIGTQVFLRMHKAAPESGANAAVASQPPASEPQTAKNEPQLSRAPQAERTEAPAQTQTPAQNSAQPVAVEESQSSAAPVPALVRNSATADTRTESRLDQRNLLPQDKKAAVPKEPNLSAPRSPAIQNLKIGSPSAPTRSLATPPEGTAPLTDVASTMPGGGSTPSSLLTSAGRTSNPPLPPPSSLAPASAAPAPVSAPKTVTDAKLISAARLTYPPTAKQSNVQGTVTLSATVDENGRVVSARALSGPLLLRQAAVDSVKQWKYSPALIDGKPAPSQVTVNVDFKLN